MSEELNCPINQTATLETLIFQQIIDDDLPDLMLESQERKIQKDALVRQLTRQFYETFSSKVSRLRDAPEKYPPHVYEWLRTWNAHQTRDIDLDFQSLSNQLLTRISNLARHKLDFWEEAKELLWKPAEALLDANASFDGRSLEDTFLKAVSERISHQSRYKGGCYLFSSNLYRERIDIGPLRIVIGANTEWAGSFYKELNDKAILQERSESKFPHGITPATWVIRLPATLTGFRPAMRWYVDIFTSLLRLGDVRHVNAPWIGYVEADPFIYQEHGSGGIEISGSKICQVGANEQVHYYSLVAESVEDIRSDLFQTRFDTLINSGNETAGDRLAHSFAWMSRARRERDQETRLLFFFTAIEALLSSTGEGGTPVTDTIARSASVLIASEPSEREKIHRYTKRLYGLRSAVAHRGEPHVYRGDAREVQELAERIAKKYLETVDLHGSSKDVRAKMLRASFGLAWPIVEQE